MRQGWIYRDGARVLDVDLKLPSWIVEVQARVVNETLVDPPAARSGGCGADCGLPRPWDLYRARGAARGVDERRDGVDAVHVLRRASSTTPTVDDGAAAPLAAPAASPGAGRGQQGIVQVRAPTTIRSAERRRRATTPCPRVDATLPPSGMLGRGDDDDAARALELVFNVRHERHDHRVECAVHVLPPRARKIARFRASAARSAAFPRLRLPHRRPPAAPRRRCRRRPAARARGYAAAGGGERRQGRAAIRVDAELADCGGARAGRHRAGARSRASRRRWPLDEIDARGRARDRSRARCVVQNYTAAACSTGTMTPHRVADPRPPPRGPLGGKSVVGERRGAAVAAAADARPSPTTLQRSCATRTTMSNDAEPRSAFVSATISDSKRCRPGLEHNVSICGRMHFASSSCNFEHRRSEVTSRATTGGTTRRHVARGRRGFTSREGPPKILPTSPRLRALSSRGTTNHSAILL